MIGTFKARVPDSIFLNEKQAIPKGFKKKIGKKLGIISIIYWDTDSYLTSKNGQSSSQDKPIDRVVLPSNYKEWVDYNESIWFSVDDLKAIFSPQRIANALPCCQAKSKRCYADLCDQFARPSLSHDAFADGNHCAMKRKTGELGNDLPDDDMEAFLPGREDLFIDETGLYLLLSRLKSAPVPPRPNHFLIWIHERVTTPIRSRNRLIAFKWTNNEKNGGNPLTWEKDAAIKSIRDRRKERCKVTRQHRELICLNAYQHHKKSKHLERTSLHSDQDSNKKPRTQADPCVNAGVKDNEDNVIIILEDQDRVIQDDIMIIEIVNNPYNNLPATTRSQTKPDEWAIDVSPEGKDRLIEDHVDQIDQTLPEKAAEAEQQKRVREEEDSMIIDIVDNWYDNTLAATEEVTTESPKRPEALTPVLEADVFSEISESLNSAFDNMDVIGEAMRSDADLVYQNSDDSLPSPPLQHSLGSNWQPNIITNVMVYDMPCLVTPVDNRLPPYSDCLLNTMHPEGGNREEWNLDNRQSYHDELALTYRTAHPGKLYLIRAADLTNVFRLIAFHTDFGEERETIKKLYGGIDLQCEAVVGLWVLERLDWTFFLYDYLLKQISASPMCMRISEETFFCEDYDKLIAMIDDIIQEIKCIYFI